MLNVLSGINHSHVKKPSWFRDDIDISKWNQYRD